MRAQYLDRMDIERERGITIKAQNVRLPWTPRTGEHRHRVRAAHDRHPGPRRLHLRGVPRRWPPARARCCSSTPRRASRRRRWPTSTWRWRTTSRSSRCSTRSTCRPRSRRSTPRRSRTSSAASPTTCCGSAARPARASPELLDAIVATDPARRSGDADGPARAMIFDSVYDIYRGVITYVRVVDGRISAARADQDDVDRRHPRAARDRRHLAGAQAGREPRRRRGRLLHHRGEGRPPVPGRRHRHRCSTSRPPSRSAATATRSRWSTPASTRSTAATTRCCARRWTSCGSTTPRWSTSRRRRRRSASASASASSACCTWRSSASGWSARPASSLISTAPNVVYRVVMEDGTEITVTNPSDWPAGKIADDLRAGRQGHDHRAQRLHRRDHGALPGPPRPARRHGLPVASPASSCATRCRSARSSSTSSTR